MIKKLAKWILRNERTFYKEDFIKIGVSELISWEEERSSIFPKRPNFTAVELLKELRKNNLINVHTREHHETETTIINSSIIVLKP